MMQTAASPAQAHVPARRVCSFGAFHVALLLLLGAGSLLFWVIAAQMLPVTSENMYPESAAVLSAQRWAQGLPLYEDYRKPPYLATSFTPLCYAAMAAVAKFGVNDLDQLTWAGRVISLICLAAVALLGFLWNVRRGIAARISAVTPLLYLSFPALVPWAITARPDFPALALDAAALYVGRFWSSRLPAVLGAGVLAALACLIRHNAVAAPVALVLWWVLQRKWKNAFVFCAAWAAVFVPTIVAFNSASDGMLLLNLSGSKFGVFSGSYVRDILARMFATPGQGFTVLLFSLGLYSWVDLQRQNDKATLLERIYLLVAFGIALLGSAAAGAAINHYLEPAFALAVLAAPGLAQLQHTWKSESASSAVVLALVVGMLVPALDAQRGRLKQEKPANYLRLVELIQGKQSFTDIPFLAARMSQPQLVDLASLMNTEVTAGRNGWSSAGVLEQLRNKQYEFVVLSVPVEEVPIPGGLYPRAWRMSADMVAAIRQHYGLCSKLDDAYVYRPRPVSEMTTSAAAHVRETCVAGEPAPTL